MLAARKAVGVVMIFRAIFWIGLVSLLAPREPDLGLGRPGAWLRLDSSVAAHLADVRAEIAADRLARAHRFPHLPGLAL